MGTEIGGALRRTRSPVVAPSGTPRPRWLGHGAITHRGSAGPTQRDYWPTAGWRTAAPKDQGMDPAVVGELDARISGSLPQVRSLLVVRHGYLVYERYWHGLAASDGHKSFSVTKSFTSALVGIALEAGHLRGLDQTVGELLAAHLPPNADPRLRRVTVQQLLTMTAGLAGDDPSGPGSGCCKAATGCATSWAGGWSANQAPNSLTAASAPISCRRW